MISSLKIENFALIDEVTIRFDKGFTVITGETGSGKSILLNALNLILGERANYSVIAKHSDKSIVEAEIDITGFGLNDFFLKNELDYFDQAIVRREITSKGRSRAFINDTPVQLSVLKTFSSQLIHIHSQYNTLELKDVDFQLKILDLLAGVLPEKEKFEIDFKRFVELKKQVSSLITLSGENQKNADYNAFQLNELTSLNLNQIEYDALIADLKKGENADEIRNTFSEVLSFLSDNSGVIDQIGQIKSSLSKRIDLDESIQVMAKRFDSISIELNDLSEEAELKLQELNFDPRKLDELIVKVDAYQRILQKHRLNKQSDLIELMNSLAENSLSNEDLQEKIIQLEEEIKSEDKRLTDKANQLHQKRLNAKSKIESDIKKALFELKLENTVLNFKLTQSEKLSLSGNSVLELLFSPNQGVEPVPVHQAASGGELSRVMLALQNLMSSKIKLRTMLFDEIDTGVSGDVAQKMGATLQKMGKEMQVIAITHLPQVAAKGAQHLKVTKGNVNGVTQTSVVELSLDERIEETARLMSGDVITSSAIENAKVLMEE